MLQMFDMSYIALNIYHFLNLVYFIYIAVFAISSASSTVSQKVQLLGQLNFNQLQWHLGYCMGNYALDSSYQSYCSKNLSL